HEGIIAVEHIAGKNPHPFETWNIPGCTYSRPQVASVGLTEAKAKEAADTARKASAYAAMWLVVSLLVGAFFASLAATYGGRRRDL
ncbi:MAG: hypothetical protein ACT6SC_20175, partial [Blastomonas fulva]